MSKLKKCATAKDLSDLRTQVKSDRCGDMPVINICSGTGCVANGATELANALSHKLSEIGLRDKVAVKRTGCHGFCQESPLLIMYPSEIFYRRVGREDLEQDVTDIVEKTVMKNELVSRLIFDDPITGKRIANHHEIPFYQKQTRIVLRNSGRINPRKILDYIASDGYMALEKLIEMKPEDVIEHIMKSRLRGRGGAGFPTGRKWSLCRNAQNKDMRYIICNADEGDPGAFMDRSIMEGDPHSVIEGMIIGAYAMSHGICPTEGYIYIRAEYPLAVDNLKKAIEDARETGILGMNILGSGFDFDITIKKGAGAFVCGEETALIASIEGKRGMPKTRPPFPAEKGLFGLPTNINNVETWANIPPIINNGGEWFASIGTENSTGTKVFSLVGKVKNSGLVEVPMGMSLREVVFDIGGGIIDDKKIKAVQTGGPSGGCIPAHMLDIPVDYEKLAEAGAIMGSGGLVVIDEETCMVELARYFIEFTQNESCGKCVPCRLGTRQMLQILTSITRGDAKPGDLELLENIASAVSCGSLCALGKTAPNPVLTTMKYFREEYEAHINEKRCPAGKCENLLSFNIIPENCIGCTACAKACPANAISGKRKEIHIIDKAKCTKCGACLDACKFNAVNRA